MAAPDPRNLDGEVIAGKYRIQESLGSGTMGAVYLAEHVAMKKRVAIKVLHPSHVQDEEVVERFQREAQAAANIDHPNICAATDFGQTEDGLYYLVMEYLDGAALIDLLRAGEDFEAPRALHIAIQICSALEKAHEVGVVHRDLKPENVLIIEREGERDFVKITDFGVAKVRMFKDTARLTQAGVVYGSPLYMSPEQAGGKEVDHRADLYSVGVMLYELLTGELPFYAKTLPLVLNMHLSQTPPPMKEKAPDIEVDPELEAVVMKLLSKKKEERFQSAEELRLELERHHARLSGTAAASDGSSNKTVVLAAAVAASIAMVLVAAAILMTALGDTDGDATSGETVEAPDSGFAFDPEEVYRVSDERKKFRQRPRVKAALELLEDDPEAAAEALIDIKTREPDSSHIHFLLGNAFIKQDQWENAFESYEEAIRLNPAYARDTQLLDDVMARFEEGSDLRAQQATDFIKAHIGSAGTRRLAEVAEHHKHRKVRKRALSLLEETGQFDEIPRWNQLTIRLRHAVGCDANKELVIKIGENGDSRALGALRRFSALPKTGCGEGEAEDCYGCLREDLRQAIERLESAN